MPEVIDLLSSSSPPSAQPDTLAIYRSPRNQPSALRTSSSQHFLSDDIDASLFVYDSPAQSAKRRRLTPVFDTVEDNRLSVSKTHTTEPPFIFSDDDNPALPPTNRTDAGPAVGKIYKWDGEEADPIVFTSSAPEPGTSKEGLQLRHNARETTVITIDDDIEKFSDPFALPENPLSCLLDVPGTSRKANFSNRTAALLASLEDQAMSKEAKLKPEGSSGKGTGRNDPDFSDTMLDEEVIGQPHPPVKSRKQPKISAEEKEARAREREAAKAQRERDKEAEKERKRKQKEEKAREKQLAADLAEVNKLKIDKKISTPEMIVDLASTIENTSVGDQVTEFMKHLGVERTFFASIIPNTVRWRRKVKATFNEEAGHWEPCPLHIRQEKHVLCLVSAQEFVNMAITLPPGENPEDPENPENLELHVIKVKSAYADCQVIYLIEGLTAWMRKNQNSRNRAYQAEVLHQMNDTNSLGDSSNAPSISSHAKPRKKKAKKPEDTPPVDDDIIEDALLQLQVTYGCLIHHTTIPTESAEWIKNFTEHISTIPYRQERMDLNDSAFCMDVGQVKPGDDRADTFVKMLQEINRVTAPMAYGIATTYPSVTDLLRGMKQGDPSILEDLRKSANKNGALTDSRIGPAVSRRLYKVFMGLDPSSTDI